MTTDARYRYFLYVFNAANRPNAFKVVHRVPAGSANCRAKLARPSVWKEVSEADYAAYEAERTARLRGAAD